MYRPQNCSNVFHLQVDENMKRAQKRDALRQEEFYFRKDITTCVSPPAATSCCQTSDCCDVYTPMTIDQIINGKVTLSLLYCFYTLRMVGMRVCHCSMHS
jgi:hypothetical protein